MPKLWSTIEHHQQGVALKLLKLIVHLRHDEKPYVHIQVCQVPLGHCLLSIVFHFRYHETEVDALGRTMSTVKPLRRDCPIHQQILIFPFAHSSLSIASFEASPNILPLANSYLALGCVTCRARKVKCDERAGICLNCERLHLECQRADGTQAAPTPAEQPKSSQSPAFSLGDVGVKRKRTFRSCVNCRASKARCSGQKPSCARCIQRSVDCVYEEDFAPQWTRVVQQPETPAHASSHRGNSTTHAEDDATSSHENTNENCVDSPTHVTMSIETSAQPATTTLPTVPVRRSASVRAASVEEGPDSLQWLFRPQLPNRQKVRILAKEYFENIHPLRCYAFIHRPSFIQRLDESSTEDHARNALLHIVCALGAK